MSNDKMPPRKRLRLLEVTLQAVFVVDDGENITKLLTDPTVVPGSAWAGYAEEWPELVKQLEDSLNQ
jgi:hypothetical protein